jgi:TonB family protein
MLVLFVLWRAKRSVCQNEQPSPSTNPTEMPSTAADISVVHTSELERFDSQDREKLGVYPSEVLSKVRSKWYPQIPDLANANELKPGLTVIEFTLKRNGLLRSARRVESCGSPLLDDAAYKAVVSSAPFSVFPPASGEKQLTFRMHFAYSQSADPGTAMCNGPNLGAPPIDGVVVYRVRNGVEPPRVIFAPDPEYTEEARKVKYQSDVTVGGTVNVDGTFSDLCIVQAAGLGLDARAIETIGKWKFEPATLNGQAVPVRIPVEVTYRLY